MSESEVEAAETPPEAEPNNAAPEPASADATAPTPPMAMPMSVPLRSRALGFGVAYVAFMALVLHHALAVQVPHGALLGLVTTFVATLGVLHGLGLLAPRDTDVAVRETALFPLPGEHRFFAPCFTLPAALLVAVASAVLSGGHALPLAIGLLLACAVAGLSALRRPALIPVVVLTAIYLPMLGSFALWDPWETHYGEVAREMLSRDDWISPWWAQEKWFWSKPVLVFWTEAWTMSALGVEYVPDAPSPHPEWAMRLPVFVMSLIAVCAIQAFASRAFGRRAGILAALVVGTMPQFFLLAHQAITDMPLSAAISVAVASFGIACLAHDDALPRTFRIGRFGVSTITAATGTVVLLALPQIAYLFSRNLLIDDRFRLRARLDVFLEGSAGNHGIPGNPVYADTFPVYPNLQPATQGAIWLVVLAATLAFLVRTRTRRDVAMVWFYVACAFGLVGKGIPGVALPGLVALLYLVVSGRWKLLTGGALRIWSGVFVVVLLGLPWYVAMTIRHGRGFLDRILVHDHINRLAVGVHGDNGPIDYFLAQLGYGTFPWVGLIPVAMLSFLYLGRGGAPSDEREAARIAALWGLSAFTLFNAMVTKFHHYIFPVVPPAGMLVGVMLDRLTRDDEFDPRGTALAVLGTLAGLAGLMGLYGNVRGIVPEGENPAVWGPLHGMPTFAVIALVLASGALLVSAARRLRGASDAPLDHVERGLALAALGAAVVAAFVGRDTSWVTATRPAGQERLAQLFIYMYSRPFPEYLDYRPVFTAISIVATAAMALLAFRATRRVALRALLVAALSLTAFAVNVYLPDVAEHWSTNVLVDRYYHQRRPNEPLVAFQMNWKGENFYTGNRVHVFQELDTAPLRNYLFARRGQSLFVLVEHSRLEGFRALLPPGSHLEKRSTMRDNNKFVLGYVRISPPPAT